MLIYGSGSWYCWQNLKALAEADKSLSMSFLRNELLMGNVLELRNEVSKSVGYLPWTWALLMKHVVPQTLLVLFFNLFFCKTDYGNIEFGNYSGYMTWPFQVVGVCSALLVFGVVLGGALDASLFDFLIRGSEGDDNDGESDSDWVTVELQEQQGADNKDIVVSSTDYSNMDELEQSQNQQNLDEGAIGSAPTVAPGVVLP